MPSIYDINFPNFASQMLPPDKRNPVITAFLKALLSPLQWIRDLWFGSYRSGAICSVWNSATTYAKYAQVIYNTSVYQSLINGNTSVPTTISSWALVQVNFIGMQERILFNGQNLVLTYALNSYLKTSFRQPPATSDVYITPGAVVISGFRVGQTIGSSVGLTTSPDKIGARSVFSTPINFIIHIPAAVYAATTELSIRDFANKYIPISLNYSIVTY